MNDKQPSLSERLRQIAEDPMWPNHVEVRKRTITEVADELDRRARELDEAHDFHARSMIAIGKALGIDLTDEPRCKWVALEASRLRAELQALKAQEPVAWKWVNKVSGGKGVYFEDPAKFMNLDHPDYEWSKLFASPVPPAPAPAAERIDMDSLEQYLDEKAVEELAAAMKHKLADARNKGRCGWQNCPPDELSMMLREHVEKGDPRDVANFCAFLWSLGSGIAKAVSTPSPAQKEPSRSQALRDAGFTARDTRLTCDECGKKFTAQMLPAHFCEPEIEQDVTKP